MQRRSSRLATPSPTAIARRWTATIAGLTGSPNDWRRGPAARLSASSMPESAAIASCMIARRICSGRALLARLDRDVLSVPGVKWVVLMEGINDIGHSTSANLPEQDVSAEQIIGGMKQIITRVHERGAKIYGATLTPYEGTTFHGFYQPAGEVKREAVNAWIRSGGSFDAVIDFDAAVRDPDHPTRIRADYDVGDHLHPNDAGYRAMGDAVDLKLFE